MMKWLGWYSRLLLSYVSKASCFSVFSSPPVEMVDFLHAIGLMYIWRIFMYFLFFLNFELKKWMSPEVLCQVSLIEFPLCGTMSTWQDCVLWRMFSTCVLSTYSEVVCAELPSWRNRAWMMVWSCGTSLSGLARLPEAGTWISAAFPCPWYSE